MYPEGKMPPADKGKPATRRRRGLCRGTGKGTTLDDKNSFHLPWQYPKKFQKTALYQRSERFQNCLLHHYYTICERPLI